MYSTYKYTSTNALTTKQNYQYTPWHGSRFVTDYFENRENYIEKLEVSKYSLEHVKQINSIYDHYKLSTKYKSSITLKLLSILKSIASDSESKDHLNATFVERLLQKFEVTKRIYSDYDSNFKPLSKNYHTIINYILFSIILLLKQRNADTYRYLNSALKLNDLVISISDKHLLPEVKELMNISLRLELSSIQSLTRNQYHND